MKCCNCPDIDLVKLLTRKGVFVNYCPKCQGIWLDKGEIFYFTDRAYYVQWKIEEALKELKTSALINPQTQQPLVQIHLLGGKLIFDYCPETGGIWLEASQLDNIQGLRAAGLDFQLDKINTNAELEQHKSWVLAWPNLRLARMLAALASILPLILILAILVNLDIIDFSLGIYIGFVLGLLQFIFAPNIMDLSLKSFYGLEFTSLDKVSKKLKTAIEDNLEKNKIKLPKLGIIYDGTPNIFSYGNPIRKFRLVITSGLLELLEPEELKAVIGQALANLTNPDVLIMTAGQIIPTNLYYLYKKILPNKLTKPDRFNAYRYIGAQAVYLLYFLFQYPNLWFLRLRQYYADRMLAYQGQTNELVKAWLKISYCLAGKDLDNQTRHKAIDGLASLGMIDPNKAKELAIINYEENFLGLTKENIEKALQWDLWNPWAFYYELKAMQPLLVKRIQALARVAKKLNQEPYLEFDNRKPGCYWDKFSFDLFIEILPKAIILITVILFSFSQNALYLGLGLFSYGLAYLFYILIYYKTTFFTQLNIASLFKKIKFSLVKPIPCIVNGTIIGPGIRGMIYDDNYLLQDNTGVIFLDYKQPLKLSSYFFSLLNTKNYVGEKVMIKGWYRRGPIPYIEIFSLESQENVHKNPVLKIKVITAIFLIILGILLAV